MISVEKFINDHKIGYETIDLEKEMPTYLEEMQRGLDGKESSLLMIPSYISLKPQIELLKKVVCVDAGGTNFRIAEAYFDADGRFVMDGFERHIMPGVSEEVTADEFFNALAELIAPYARKTKNLAISFAYRAKILEDIDCEIFELTKELKVSGIEGRHLCKEIISALEKMGIPGVRAIALNDTVATALAGKAEKLNEGFGTFTGTILGTGNNSCYMEKISNIGKISGLDKNGVMLINTEAGSYDKQPRADIDIAYSNSMTYPNIGVSEKMISGAYFGGLCLFVLKAAAREGVFEEPGVLGLEKLSTMAVSEFLMDGVGTIREYFSGGQDIEAVRALLENMVKRAARVCALQMAAMAMKSHKENNRACMVIEGTTYEKMPGMKEEIKKVLFEYLANQGLEAELITIDSSVIKGCAIAGLSQKS